MIQQIINGDCMAIIKEITSNSVSVVLTDPPYGVDYQSKAFGRIIGDREIDANFLPEAYRILKDGGALYLFTRWDVYAEWFGAVKMAGFNIRNCLIWNRMCPGPGDVLRTYAPAYDMIIFASKGDHLLNGRPMDVLSYLKVTSGRLIHPTQKPVELIRGLIITSSREGELIFDGYAGSGTTAVAAKSLNRGYICVEIDPGYFEIMRSRVAQTVLIGLASMEEDKR